MRTPLANSCGRQMTVTHGTLLRRRFLRNDKACLTEAITFWGVFGCAASLLLRGSSLAEAITFWGVLAVLGLQCCVGFSLVAESRGYSSLQCTCFSL